MFSGILVLIITIAAGLMVISHVKSKFHFVDTKLLTWLLGYHVFFMGVYYLYALFNPSDSKYYYSSVLANFGRIDWFGFYGTSTTFIKFLAYPFVNYLGFSYEASMVLFSFFGYLGFIFTYLFFKENIKFRHSVFGVDLLTIIFFLPNLHFWSSSLGKGSVIFFGIALFFFGLGKLRTRLLGLLIGGFIIYHVRPHIMLVILVASVIGFVFSTKGIGLVTKGLFLIAASVAFFFIYKDVLALVGIEEDEFISEGLNLTHRASELGKATSGIDIASYSLPEQLFAFLYRPLFFDAPGLLGIIVSFENIFYLWMTIMIFNFKGLRFLISGNFFIKTAFVSFITVSIALAQVSGNLGLAIRQKTQVMTLFLFVIISYRDNKMLNEYRRMAKIHQRKARLSNLTQVKSA